MTPTEGLLAELCQDSFLRLWSYANPHKDDGHEFCDVVAMFEDHVFIFFDREKHLAAFGLEEDAQVRWERWRRNAVDKQIATAHGAERYLRSGRPIFLDAKGTKPLPVPLDLGRMVVHKIVVAHGAAEACKSFSDANTSGSLAVSYSDLSRGVPPPWPFMVHLDRNSPVHVLDSHTLPIILGELDTVKDFSSYLDAKLEAISGLDVLTYCGEEDLLAHYWLNIDEATNKHFIGVKGEQCNGLNIAEGEWASLITSAEYRATKKANEISYVWDRLLHDTCGNWVDGTLYTSADLLAGPNAVLEMAKEPRFMRRAAAEAMAEAINRFPFSERDRINRHVRFFRSFYENKGYVFLQLWVPEHMRGDDEVYRAKRVELLRIACAAAKLKFPFLTKVVGIAMDAPRLTKRNSEDLAWMDCSEWSEQDRQWALEANEKHGFFTTGAVREQRISEFVSGEQAVSPFLRRPGRNEPCPCGSGRKFKRCHGP